MREKDIIVSIDGEKIETIANLHEQISKYRPETIFYVKSQKW